MHNGSQGLHVGRGSGFCLHHGSVIQDPANTTCKYLHRKDLPYFLVDEGVREHASEFTQYPALAHLYSGEPIKKVFYSERWSWETKSFDPLTNAIANYHKSSPSWIFIETLTGGVDGRRASAHASLTRRYLARCAKWQSSYRLVLAVVQDLAIPPVFQNRDLLGQEDSEQEAFWDTIFTKIALIQEYGWHSGIEMMHWFSDYLGDSVVSFEWSELQPVLEKRVGELTDLILTSARAEGEYFGVEEVDTDEIDPSA